MARPFRSDLPDGIYHVGTRGVADTFVFRDDVDRVTFLRLLADVAGRYAWRFYAYCLMSTHYHLIFRAKREDLSRGLHRLNGIYAHRFNARHRRHGHLFGDRFFAEVIEDDDYLFTACEYVLQNPVRAGLCTAPDDWPWSRSNHLRPARL
jgi:putative transposase